MSPEVSTLLSIGTEIARFRGAQQLTGSDVALAFTFVDRRPVGELFADAQASPSPTMLPFDDRLTALFSVRTDVGLDDLRAATRAERQALCVALDAGSE